MSVAYVAVAVATLWASPSVARPLTPAQELRLTTAERRALVGKVETQALRGERVVILARQGRWVKVAVPDQPSPRNAKGYPGWMLASQLTPNVPSNSLLQGKRSGVIATAKRFLGRRYVWGGTSPWGFDCSGLTWYTFRAAGVTIPRDADAQFAGGKIVSLEDARPGDLVFYGVKHVHHVALYLGKGKMIESPDSAHAVRIVPLRTGDFAGVRRFSLSR